MTTIACNRSMMAADTLMDDEGMITYTTKIFRVPGAIIGFAGEVAEGLKFIEWYKDQEEDLELENTSAIVLTSKGIFTYESEHPIVVREPYYSIGSGKSYAMNAMDNGHKPDEAIRQAMRRDTGTGGEIDVLILWE